jgi:transposase InsO family protein
MPVAEVFETILQADKNVSYSAVYRTLVRYEVNKIPQEKRQKTKEFKEYDPGFLHIDVTYLPAFGGQKYYLFVAIDRATRLMFYKIYTEKSADNAELFLQHCKDFFPFNINKILTDNGLEFTNRLIKSKKGELCQKDSKFDVECKKDENHQIEHRLTKPHTPKTNGMVERVNGTIKNSTILKTKYLSKQEMEIDLLKFLVFYNLNRRHGSLRKELGVRTPFDALNWWYEKKPEIFLKIPLKIKNYLLTLLRKIAQDKQQPCET